MRALRVRNPGLVGQTLTVSVATGSGVNYTVEYKNTLTDANWTSAQKVVGDGTTLTLTDANATPSARFYRVRAE